jgi:hypothetical protein
MKRCLTRTAVLIGLAALSCTSSKELTRTKAKELIQNSPQLEELGQGLDQRFRKASAAQEDFRDLALRTVERVDADAGRALVQYLQQSLGLAQVHIGESGLVLVLARSANRL